MTDALQERSSSRGTATQIAAHGTEIGRYDGGTGSATGGTMESQVFIGSAAASIAAHLALAVSIFLAEARPFDNVPQRVITVDIVSSKEIGSPAKEDLPKPSQTFPPDRFDNPDNKPQTDTKAAKAPMQSSPVSSSSSSMPTASQQATLQPSPQPHTTPPSYNAPEPDISVRYGVLLGLPAGRIDDDSGAAEAIKADISAMDTAQFRRHLTTCSKMPASVSPGDNIRIVLRVPFTIDGTIAAPPALIEASASAKGPALMKGAIKALMACQPYAMLPPDKYDQWKVLDLSFTPRDFSGS